MRAEHRKISVFSIHFVCKNVWQARAGYTTSENMWLPYTFCIQKCPAPHLNYFESLIFTVY